MRKVRIDEHGSVIDVATGEPLVCPLSRVACGRDCALFAKYTESIGNRDHNRPPVTTVRCLYVGKDIGFFKTPLATIKKLRNRPAPPSPPQP